jgi:uncharacterized protein (TIGR01777 family)
MKVAVSGATGTIGSALVAGLLARGDEVTALSRDSDRARSRLAQVQAVEWRDPVSEPAPAEALGGRDAVVHLLGEPIAQRWSSDARREIRESRVLGTRNLVAGLRQVAERPSVLISQSGAGWYGHRGEERLDESAPAGDDFLAELAVAWEAEADQARKLGMRVVQTRTGVVLSPSGGALERMLPFFKLGVGGPVAGGRQYVPWVHLDDVVGAILACLDDDAVSGPVNVTAPEPVTNRELSKALGKVLRRPALAPVPGLAVKLLYGEMSDVVTTGQRAIPGRLEQLGYRFRRPDLDGALRDAVGR